MEQKERWSIMTIDFNEVDKVVNAVKKLNLVKGYINLIDVSFDKISNDEKVSLFGWSIDEENNKINAIMFAFFNGYFEVKINLKEVEENGLQSTLKEAVKSAIEKFSKEDFTEYLTNEKVSEIHEKIKLMTIQFD